MSRARTPPPHTQQRPASLRPFFEPRTIAVIGAGRTRGRVGAEIFHNLADGGFTGDVFPVNPCATAIGSVPAWPTIRDVPAQVDLAIIAVPAAHVDTVFEDCVAARVPAVIIITAGFGETGGEGREHERRLRDRARRCGMRLVGPNCLGVVNTDPRVRLNASFAPALPPAGTMAFSSQSGALGLAVLEYARQLNLGLSSFVSIGNKADVSSNDLLEYWEQDPRTNVILLYVESFGNPRRFGRIARRVGQRKPVIAVKSGRSRSGARAAASHTGALASSDRIVDALFRDAGVIRTATLEELFETAVLLAHQPPPAGRRVGILSNAGGPAILAADACEGLGLEVPPLSARTGEALRAFLAPGAGTANPVDMLATAPADHYRRAIPLMLADPGIDALLTIFIPPLVTSTSEAAAAIAETTRAAAKPVLATFFGAAGVPDILAPVPCYAFPESAARALAHATRYAAWRAKPVEPPAQFPDMDLATVRTLIASHSSDGGWLSSGDCSAVLDACGIPSAPVVVVRTRHELADAARRLGFPLALKGTGPALVHKTDAGTVFLDIADEAGAVAVFDALSARAEVTGVVVQPMLAPGVEMLVGAAFDPDFGHLVMCGSGGTLVELLDDAACRLAPLSDGSVREMLDEVRGVARLRGFRGAPPLDESALRAIVLRVAALVTACPGIVELDLNPVIVSRSGTCVADARIRVGVAEPSLPRQTTPPAP